MLVGKVQKMSVNAISVCYRNPGSTLPEGADDRVITVSGYATLLSKMTQATGGISLGHRYDQRRRAHGFCERTDCGGRM